MTNRLTITVGGLTLRNPVVCGAGEPVMTEAGIRAALAAGVAGVIAKSANERPEAAAQLDRADYAFLPDARPAGAQPPDRPLPPDRPSLLNRSGLIQRDTRDWFTALAAIDRDAAQAGQFVAASIVLAGRDGAVKIARTAAEAGLRVLELNVGAPHASEAAAGAIRQENDSARLRALVTEVRAACGPMQLWVKLAGLADLPALALAATEGGADAVCMMGRFMALLPDLDTHTAVLGTSAAYGGGWALPIVCRFLAQSRAALPAGFPLIGTNGVRTGADVLRMALAGASAIEALSVVMHGGFGALTRMIEEVDAYLEQRGLMFPDIVGRAADALQTYGMQPPSPERWKDFVPPETLA